VWEEAQLYLLGALEAVAHRRVVDQLSADEILIHAQELEHHLLGSERLILEGAHIVAVREGSQLGDLLALGGHVALGNVLAEEEDLDQEARGERGKRWRRVGERGQLAVHLGCLVLSEHRRAQQHHRSPEVQHLHRLGGPNERMAEQCMHDLLRLGQRRNEGVAVLGGVRGTAQPQDGHTPVL
jgi:hypothetical protein